MSLHAVDQSVPETPIPREDDDTWSVEVNDLLRDLDRFTFSSGKSIPLSQTKKSRACRPPLRETHNNSNNVNEALEEAKRERESAREWAQAMRQSVNKWMKEQKETLQEQSQEFETQKEIYEETIRALRAKNIHLQDDLKQSLERYLQSETHLHNTIKAQQERIKELEASNNTPLTPQSMPGTPSSSSRKRMQLDSGAELIVYRNGSQREIHQDGTIITRFPNGDIETKTNQTTAYYFISSNTIQVTQKDGSVVWEYPSGQMERHWPDGRKIIRFPNGSLRKVNQNGQVYDDIDPNETYDTLYE